MYKSLLFISTIVFLTVNVNAQCLVDRHSATWYDGWISCEERANPNSDRPDGHWIWYDLEDVYYLFEMNVWNMNSSAVLDYGLQNVYVDVSTDNVNWTEIGQFIFSQAPGQNDYEGIEEVDFGGIKARYVLITAIDNYGGSCYGLSEVRIRARDICPSNVVAWIADDGDWNIPSNWCNNQIPTTSDSVWIPPFKNIVIPDSYSAVAKWLDVAKNSSIEIIGDLQLSE